MEPISVHSCIKNCELRIVPRQSAPNKQSAKFGKISQFIIASDSLLAQAKQKVVQLQRDSQQMQQEGLHLQGEIKKLKDERQEFITKARKERMPDEEFTSQMSALYDKERGVQRKLITIEQAKDDFMKLDLEEQVKKYEAELQSEMAELIHANPQTPEERHQVFMLKKRIVNTVLEGAGINENREIHVKFRTNFLLHER